MFCYELFSCPLAIPPILSGRKELYLHVPATAMDICKAEQTQCLQRPVTMLQGNLHGLLQEIASGQ